jgi:DNA-binding NtrC family response regulator
MVREDWAPRKPVKYPNIKKKNNPYLYDFILFTPIGIVIYQNYYHSGKRAFEILSGESLISIPMGSTMEQAERAVIRDTLGFFKGNKSKPGEVLKIGRKTLHRKLAEWGAVTDGT